MQAIGIISVDQIVPKHSDLFFANSIFKFIIRDNWTLQNILRFKHCFDQFRRS